MEKSPQSKKQNREIGLCVLPNVNINNKFFNAFEWRFIEMKKTTKSLLTSCVISVPKRIFYQLWKWNRMLKPNKLYQSKRKLLTLANSKFVIKSMLRSLTLPLFLIAKYRTKDVHGFCEVRVRGAFSWLFIYLLVCVCVFTFSPLHYLFTRHFRY